jgi:hypothetical protein
MRTKEQQKQSNHKGKDLPMIEQIKTTVERSRATLLSDAIGAMALMVILVVGLHLPNFS